MEITIHEIDANTLQDVNKCDGAFTVDSKLVLRAEDGIVTYSIVSVEPYQKKYPLEDLDYNSYVSNPNQTIFLAYVDGRLAGQIRVLKSWNGYACIDDIVVDSRFRRQGLGRALIQRVIAWAKDKGFPGIRLETQNNNIAGCRLYESCGFVLGGFDRYLYTALHPGTDEIALYWYLMF